MLITVVAKIRTALYMTYYLMWRVLTKQHKEITISFLPVGHTLNSSQILALGCSSASSEEQKLAVFIDIAEVVRRSAKINHCQLVGNQHVDVFVPIIMIGLIFCRIYR